MDGRQRPGEQLGCGPAIKDGGSSEDYVKDMSDDYWFGCFGEIARFDGQCITVSHEVLLVHAAF
jgi:hypothetical protein